MEELRANEQLVPSDDEDEMLMDAILEAPDTAPQPLTTLRDLCTFKVMCMTGQRDLDLTQRGIHPFQTAKQIERLWKENQHNLHWICTVYDQTNVGYFRFLCKELQREFSTKTYQLRLWAKGIEETFYTQRIDMQETFSDVVYRCNIIPQ